MANTNRGKSPETELGRRCGLVVSGGGGGAAAGCKCPICKKGKC